MSGFDPLATSYDAGRIGYSNAIYDSIMEFGARSESRVIDIGCGTGLAAAPLLAAGFSVTGVDISESMLDKARARMPGAHWMAGEATALPFGPQTFDVAISAQTFHWFDRTKAIAEMARVLTPGGVAAIWWKNFTASEPIGNLRVAVAHDMGVTLPESKLTGGFREFYGSTLTEKRLRVLPWQIVVPQARYLDYERSRLSLREALGDRHEEYISLLASRVSDLYGGASVPLSYIQYLYLGKA